MIIAINTIQLQTNTINFDVDFLVELMLYKAKQEPNNRFVFIVNTPVDVSELPTNCTTELVRKEPASTNSLLLFSTVTLPTLLKKIKADMVYQVAGYGCITGNIQQIIFLNTAISSKALLVRKSLQKASKIVVGSEMLQNALPTKISNQIAIRSKFEIITGAAHNLFKPLNYIETNLVKDGHADGRDYFLAVASVLTFHEFINLLKAFSAFKKWQKSSMKLLVLGHVGDYKNQLSEKIATYKYREDVQLLESEPLDVEAKLFGAAYAVLSLANQSQYHLPILQAFQANVPVICLENNSFSEAINSAVLTVVKDDAEAIATQMKLLYRDENLRSQKIAEGQSLSEIYTYDNAYQQLQKVGL
ncbi:glycosyltransferase [Parasediminibacterium paludis]|uniref:Glycosyltransferase n=1 Tax=Parasediminibacterium paludis TaxID=908966 RepID=A0ABV8Q0V6_9BACT